MTSAVYAIRNRGTGKVYVGSAKSVSYRWTLHCCALKRGAHHSVLLQRAWIKYGEGSFEFSILQEVPEISLLVAVEQEWIDKLRSADPQFGYNVAPVAGSRLGMKASAESREKMRKSHEGIEIPEATRAAQRATMIAGLAARMQLATVAARKASGTYGHSEASRLRIGAAGKGRVPSAETLAKRSESMKAVCARPEYRAQLVERGRKAAAERKRQKNDLAGDAPIKDSSRKGEEWTSGQ